MITVSCLIAILILAVNSQVFPSLLSGLGGPSLQQGLLLSSLFLLFPFASVAAGYAADRSSKRQLIILGLLLMAAAFVLSALFDRIQARTLAVLLFGLGAGIIESQSSALLSDRYPGRERSIMNISQSFFSAGAAGGPLLIALVYRLKPGTGAATFLWAAAALSTLMIGLFFLGHERPDRQERPQPAGFIEMIKKPDLQLLALVIFLYVAAEIGTAGWLAKYTGLYLDLSAELAPIAITIFWAGLGISRVLAGVLPHPVSDRVLLAGSLAFTLVAQVFTFLSGSLVPILIGIGLIGLGMGAVWPTLVAIAGRLFRESSGTAVGIMVAAGGLGTPVIQPIIGLLSDPNRLGLRFTLLGLALLTLVNLVLVLSALPDIAKKRPPSSRPAAHKGSKR